MTVDEMLSKWILITGVDPSVKRDSWTINMSGKLDDYSIKVMNDYLNDVIKYDIDGIYTKIYLKEYFDIFLKGKVLSLSTFLSNKLETIDFINLCESLYIALNEYNPDVDTIMNETKLIMDYYKMKSETVSIIDIIDYRISAFINLDNLFVAQFKRGAVSEDIPKYSRNVFMVKNIDKLIKTIETQSYNGISLNYIYDDDNPASSYFAFGIKNGDNIYFLTDKPNYTHANQKYMLRTHGRSISDRMSKSHFPYSITGIRGDKYFVADDNAKELNESGYFLLGTFSDMNIDEALWVADMFELINQKFFVNSFQCESISYVGGMIQHNLLDTNVTTLAIYDTFEKLSLPIIDNPHNIQLDYDYKSEGLNDHIIARFKDQVDIGLINSIGYSDISTTDLIAIELKKDPFHSLKNRMNDIKALNVNDFGTKDEIEYRQKWIVRYNFAEQINRLVNNEYEASIKNVYTWYKDAIHSNLNHIMSMIIKNEFDGNKLVYRQTGCVTTVNNVKSIVCKHSMKAFKNQPYSNLIRFNVHQYKNVCVFTGKDASVALCIFPNDINDLMKITGLDLKDIPVALHHWKAWRDRCEGNQILNNVDPCDWVINDPWRNFSASVVLFLTKTEYNNQYNLRGVESDRFWLNEPNEFY